MRKTWIALGGGSLLLLGAILLILPGPGVPLVLGGLALLASEFQWARTAWHWVKRALSKVRRGLVVFRRLRGRRRNGLGVAP